MSHLSPQHPGCAELPEKVLHVVKPGRRGAYKCLLFIQSVPEIFECLTMHALSSGHRQNIVSCKLRNINDLQTADDADDEIRFFFARRKWQFSVSLGGLADEYEF